MGVRRHVIAYALCLKLFRCVPMATVNIDEYRVRMRNACSFYTSRRRKHTEPLHSSDYTFFVLDTDVTKHDHQMLFEVRLSHKDLASRNEDGLSLSAFEELDHGFVVRLLIRRQ